MYQWILSGFLIVYVVFEFNYYVRGFWVILAARLWRKKVGILDTSEIRGIVLPCDGDFYFTHMNNARCFREFDFARYDNAMRNGLYEMAKNDDMGPVVAASCIRYRQPIWMFSLYKVTTTPVYWDDKILYFEQQLITLRDGIIRCVAYIKASHRCSIEEKLRLKYPNVTKPNPPEDLLKWMEYNDLNSKRINGITKSLPSAGLLM